MLSAYQLAVVLDTHSEARCYAAARLRNAGCGSSKAHHESPGQPSRFQAFCEGFGPDTVYHTSRRAALGKFMGVGAALAMSSEAASAEETELDKFKLVQIMKVSLSLFPLSDATS